MGIEINEVKQIIKINFKLYNEDCLDTMSRFTNNYIDLTVTSPPYNMRTRIRNGKYTEREKSEHFSKKYSDFHDAYPIKEYESIHSGVLHSLLEISSMVFINIQIVTGSKEAWFRIIGEFGEYLKDIAIWDKGFGQPAMHEKILNSAYELVLILENDKRAGRMIQNAVFGRGEMQNILRIIY